MKKIISLVILSLFSTTLFAGEFPDISIKELQKAIKDGKVAVIDVNGAGSYKKGHIPTAISFASNGKQLAKGCCLLRWSRMRRIQARRQCRGQARI